MKGPAPTARTYLLDASTSAVLKDSGDRRPGSYDNYSTTSLATRIPGWDRSIFTMVIASALYGNSISDSRFSLDPEFSSRTLPAGVPE